MEEAAVGAGELGRTVEALKRVCVGLPRDRSAAWRGVPFIP